MYVFDLMKAAAAGGRARYELMSKPRNPDATSGLERPKAVVNRVVSKDLNWRPQAYPSAPASCPMNKHLCRACCRILQGTGIEAINLLKTDDNGVFFEHLDCHFLEKSARSGCDMCAVVWNSHRPVKESLMMGEQIPMRYDYGHFLGSDTLYAVKFYPFALLESNGRMMPAMMPAITVTLDRVTEELSRSMVDNELPACKVSGGDISTGSSDSMSQIAKWLERCKCCAPRQPSTESHFVPDRLVDADASYPDKIHIVNGNSIAGCSDYLALSHCWGNIEAIRGFDCQLVTSRIDEFMEGIPLQRLPKTFRDAVSVARTLGIRYIWIDSLCIVQDSQEDWQHNAGLISKIYASSYLTLAATASRNSTEGLFRTRMRATLSPGIVEVAEGHPQFARGQYRCYDDVEWHASVETAPLNMRAWVFQERLLSPRIVHFAENQLYFECLEFRASERFADSIPARFLVSPHRENLPRKLGDPTANDMLAIWHTIVSEYTALALTYDSDKMAAVSAIATHLSELIPDGGRYLAGLWEHSLVGQLCWSTAESATRAKAYRAPSWSWVSVDGDVSPHFVDLANTPRDKAKAIASVIEAKTNSGSSPFLSCTSGAIRVLTPLYRISLAEPKDAQRKNSVPKQPERSKAMVEAMSTLIPGYTGENLRSFGVSSAGGLPTGLSGEQRIRMDVTEGIIQMPGDDVPIGHEERRESSRRNFRMAIGAVKPHYADIQTDEDFTREELGSLNPVFVPVFCTFDRLFPEIDTLRGLVLTNTGNTGFYRRIGSCTLDEYSLAPFLCSLANQEIERVSNNEDKTQEAHQSTIDHACQGRLRLDDLVPENWACKTLDFIPKDFAQYEITIV